VTVSLKAIEAENLSKIYPPDIRAVDSISFSVDEGDVFGLLGPNGAGKTTTIKMITTLTTPSSGWMKVFGVDVRKNPQEVRQMLGYVPQSISVDGDLTGYENLLIFAKLSYVGPAHRNELIHDALDYMGLTERADDLVKHYSGGMMRRLEIAQALVNKPRILFLDEPSIGLDPFSRRQVIGYVKQLNEEYKTTIFITTHDMAEADELCHKLAIMNSGRFAIIGSPEELKSNVGGDIVSVGLSAPSNAEPLPQDLGSVMGAEEGQLKILTKDGDKAIPGIVEFYDKQGVHVDSISLSRPTLEDVFVKYAKTSLEGAEQSFREARSARRSIVRHAQ
jgi:ABC-2 type transport system ATP-binding protein